MGAFVVYALGSGLWARKRASRSLEDYFLAGRDLRGWMAGVSMAATQFAADTPLIVMGLVATSGLFALWQLWSYGVAFLLLGFLFAPGWRRARVITDAEFVELRYSGTAAVWLRGVRALLFGVVFNAVVVAMVLYAAVIFAHGLALPNVPGWAIVAAVVALALVYSTVGGLRSVVATDIMQFTLMMTATLLFAVIAVHAAGGLGSSVTTLSGQLTQMASKGQLGGLTLRELFALTPGQARDGSAGLVMVFALQWLLQRNADGTGYLAQRTMACRSDADARSASVWFAFLQVGARSLMWAPLALALLVLFPAEPGLVGVDYTREREGSFVLGMRELLPPGALGLMVTAMLAALASTIDTHLNWGSSYVANDLYGRLYCQALRGREPERRRLVWVARLGNVAILAFAAAVMTQLESIQQAWKVTLVLGAGIGVPTVLRWIWWRMTAWGELASIVASFAIAPVALEWGSSEAVRMLGVAGVGTAAAIVASLVGPPNDPEKLRRFAERVKPPGFWGGVIPGRGGPRELARALGATAAASVSLFASLLAGLELLFPGMDGSPPWTGWALLAVALAALPLWLPQLRR